MALAGAEVVYADQWKLITILCKNYLEIVKDHSCFVVPSCFAGHSGGCVLKQELPRQLELTGEPGSCALEMPLGGIRTTSVAGDSSAAVDPGCNRAGTEKPHQHGAGEG